MTEHEKLKEICDKIGFYMIGYTYRLDGKILYEDTQRPIKDIREIIFTQEFINKIKEYLQNKNFKAEFILKKVNGILMNLDNPVEYLYNKIKNV